MRMRSEYVEEGEGEAEVCGVPGRSLSQVKWREGKSLDIEMKIPFQCGYETLLVSHLNALFENPQPH